MRASHPQDVESLRAQLWDAGFRPIAILNADHPDPDRAGKAPLSSNWTGTARADPPEAVQMPAVPFALNTGILADGLRAIDFDIDDPGIAQACRALAADMLGEAPIRTRGNSSRFLSLYRAAHGEPPKIVLTGAEHDSKNGHSRKIEVLGKGQQFVAFGRHPSGADLEWFPDPPGAELLTSLPAVTEDQITSFLAEAAPLIGAVALPKINGHDHAPGDPQADPLRIAAALNVIPNDGAANWEAWNRVGMAIWRATGASDQGRVSWHAWSQRNSAYDEAATEERWNHYRRSPPTEIGAGAIFHMAREANEPPPNEGINDGTVPPFQTVETVERHETHPQTRVQQLAEFMDGFVPPDYIVDGIIRRGSLYALTSPTGHGKTAVALYLAALVAAGRPVGTIETVQGDVILLAGENPDDVRTRCYAACQAYNLTASTLPIYVLPETFPLDADAAELLRQEIDRMGLNAALIIVDTAAAFFPGDDDNANVQMGSYARNLRVLTTCRGSPAVLVPAHPVKNPDRENLLPRGGGAFLNELDGNLTLWSAAIGETAALHWQGKIRGADFAQVNFALRTVKIAGLTDSKQRPIVSIIAHILADAEADAAIAVVRSDENVVLEWLRSIPDISLRNIALNSGWVGETGVANKAKVHRLLKSLQTDKLVTQKRGKWAITEAAREELAAAKNR